MQWRGDIKFTFGKFDRGEVNYTNETKDNSRQLENESHAR